MEGIINTAITIGKFDGLHIGHKELIKNLKKTAVQHNLKTIVFSFYPHPATVINKTVFKCLCSKEENKALIKKECVDEYIEYPFNELMNIPPDKFINDILKKQLKCSILIVGEGFRFGKNREGDINTFKNICPALGIKVIEIPQLIEGEYAVSSSRIKNLLIDKNFTEAEKLLGKPYFITGIVERGKRVGHDFGFPTANIKIPEDKFAPQSGVYITKTIHNGISYPSVTNIGIKPTVSSEAEVNCETNLFNFNQDIYGEEITVNFYKFIRGETKFTTIDQLKLRINEDVNISKKYWDK